MTMLVIDTTGDTDTESVVTGSRDTDWTASADSKPNVWALLVCVPKAVSACMAFVLSAPERPVSTPTSNRSEAISHLANIDVA